MVRQIAVIVSAVNYSFRGSRDRLVMFRQQLCQDWKLLHWMLRVGVKVDDICRRMFSKVLLEVVPRTWNDSVARVNTGKQPSENVASERKGYDVTRGGLSFSVKINPGRVSPNEDSVLRGRMLDQVAFGGGKLPQFGLADPMGHREYNSS